MSDIIDFLNEHERNQRKYYAIKKKLEYFRGLEAKKDCLNNLELRDIDFTEFRDVLTFKNSNFSYSKLINIYFAVDLYSSNFQNTNIESCTFGIVNLNKCDFRNSTLNNCDLSSVFSDSTNYSNATFVNCNFTHAGMTSCDFTNCKFINCKFDFIKLTNSNLKDVDLSNNNLKNSIFSGLPPIKEDIFTLKNIDSVNFNNAIITWRYWFEEMDKKSKDLDFQKVINELKRKYRIEEVKIPNELSKYKFVKR